MASCVRTVHEQRRAHTLLRALCCSERASTASVGRPVERRDGATLSADELLFTFAVQKALHRAQRRKRSPPQAHRDVPRPRHCRARARCAAPCTRAHACRARSTRTNHACAPRQPCTCSHAATRAHVKKLGCRARVTGHWLTVGRLAAGTSSANALCNALATSAAREAHASSTRCACHPPLTLSP